MHRPFRLFLAGCFLAMLGATLVSAQTFDFTLLLTSNGNTVKVPNGQTISINAAVGSQASIAVQATYTGTTPATISTQPQSWLLGSTQFTLTLSSKVTFPLVLNRGDSLNFTITFAPTNAGGGSAQLVIPYTELGPTGTIINNSINLSLNGTSPSFTLSYVLQLDNNVVQIAPGGTIPFHPTQINTTANANLNITNTGSGVGTISAIALVSGGPVFKLTGSPLFPYQLLAGQTLAIGIAYTPTAVENDTGQIKVTYSDGTTALVNLTGSGATSTYTYKVLSGGTSTPVKPNSTITLPPVTVPTSTTSTPPTSSVIVQVTNAGNANGTINSINVTGPFQLIGLPLTPPTLKPGDSESFTIVYTPTQVGVQTGQLIVGSDVFTLSGTGLGPQLNFSYVSGGGPPINLGQTGSVAFTPVAVSQSEKVTFTITNSGTSTATISLISTSPPFSLTPPPTLPLTLASGQSTQFGITFTPVTVNTVTGVLQIDSTQVQLIGSGTTPPSLPSYTLSGPSGTVSPVTQAPVSLTLAKSYPVDVSGVLTLTTSGNYGTDPSVQFSTGSTAGNRTVDFTIPANSTSADFAGQGSQILLQTGTVAETVTLTPSFTTTGGVNLTPSSPSTLQFSIPSAAPVITVLQPSNEASASFTLLITGYSTTRSLNSLVVTFNAATGYTLAGSQFTTDLSQVAALWFQSASSQPFGGLFEISIPINLTGTVPTGKTLLGTIASVSATVSNSVGTSNSLQANLP